MLYDFLGALASLIATYYFIRIDSKAWAFSIVATCLNSWLYLQNGIFADMVLEMFYFLSTCYGWYRWANSSPNEEKHIVFPSSIQWFFLVVAGIAIYAIIYYILITFTPSTIPKLDALTTSLSLIAQLLMCYKVIATWILWFITDALYFLIYSKKLLPFHAGLMIVYCIMAIIGYMSWMKQQKRPMA